MRLPIFKKLSMEDVPGAPSWVEQIIIPLNELIEQTYSNLNKNLTITDNLQATIKVFEVDGSYPIYLSWDKPLRPVSAQIGQCREVSGPHTTITSGLYLDWEYTSDNKVKVNGIAGLTASTLNKFNVTANFWCG